MKRIYGIYEVEDITKPDGSWNGFRSSVTDAKGEYGFIANTDIPIKPDANKRLDSDDLGI
jgi:protocatechuate 3,4-dioxygenase beta subunit